MSKDATLDAVVEILAASGVEWVPVLDEARRPVGMVTADEAVRGYRMALRSNIKTMGAVPRGTELLEAHVAEGAAVVGREVGSIRWPPGTVMVAVQRDEQLLLPHGDTELRIGDTLSMLVPQGREREVTTLVEGPGTGGPG